MNTLTIVSCLLIVLATIAAYYYIKRTTNLATNRKWIDTLPSLISSLGVLGTFLGITIGLIGFDPSNLDESIPSLLDGLKTAFFTSLTGMTCSLFLTRTVTHKFDKEAKKSEMDIFAEKIIDAISRSQRENTRLLNQICANTNNDSIKSNLDIAVQKIIDSVTKSQQENTRLLNQICANTNNDTNQDFDQIKDDVEELKGINQELDTILSEELPRLRALLATSTASMSEMGNNIGFIRNQTETIDHSNEQINKALNSDISQIKTSLTRITRIIENLKTNV